MLVFSMLAIVGFVIRIGVVVFSLYGRALHSVAQVGKECAMRLRFSVLEFPFW